MKVSTLLVAAMAGAASAMPLERLSSLSLADKSQLFAEFKQTFNKTYETALEERIRFNVFQEALVRIDDKNAADPHARFGITKFSDMTPAEFKVKVLADIRQSGDRPVHVPHSRPAAALPASVDWRSQEGKAIGKVRNQGQCGSCWAFSTAEQIASNWALAGNDFTVLSVEQIVDCDGTDSGCNGGDTSTAYEYVIKAGGLESEAEYPYSASEGNSGNCKFDKSKIVAKISSWKYITGSGDSSSANIEKLETQLQSSPVSICVEADTWQDYNGGIVTSNCGQNLDHCVQLAGYAASGSTKYWIVRNSWGTDWGIQGYIYVGQEDNLCGIQNESTIAIV